MGVGDAHKMFTNITSALNNNNNNKMTISHFFTTVLARMEITETG